MNNRTDTLHTIRRLRKNIKQLDNAIQKLSITNPYSASVLREDKAITLFDLEQIESFAQSMGWKYENL